jgi:hypothetical protein
MKLPPRESSVRSNLSLRRTRRCRPRNWQRSRKYLRRSGRPSCRHLRHLKGCRCRHVLPAYRRLRRPNRWSSPCRPAEDRRSHRRQACRCHARPFSVSAPAPPSSVSRPPFALIKSAPSPPEWASSPSPLLQGIVALSAEERADVRIPRRRRRLCCRKACRRRPRHPTCHDRARVSTSSPVSPPRHRRRCSRTEGPHRFAERLSLPASRLQSVGVVPAGHGVVPLWPTTGRVVSREDPVCRASHVHCVVAGPP